MGYWESDQEVFVVGGQTLRLEVGDIYFLTGFSRRGEELSMKARNIGTFTIDEYIDLYCTSSTEKIGTQIPFKDIIHLEIRSILATLQRIVGSSSSHQISRVHMYYAARCIETNVFDWSSTLLGCMKAQLNACRQGKANTFGFGSILLSFFFKQIPSLSPRVSLGPDAAMIPAMGRWTSMILRLGGGQVVHPFDDEYFDWWDRQIIAIEDYLYASIDFSRDPNMAMPPGSRP